MNYVIIVAISCFSNDLCSRKFGFKRRFQHRGYLQSDDVCLMNEEQYERKQSCPIGDTILVFP